MRVQSSSKLSFPLESLIKITIARSNNIPSIHRRPIIPRPDPSIKIGDQVRFPWSSRHERIEISRRFWPGIATMILERGNEPPPGSLHSTWPRGLYVIVVSVILKRSLIRWSFAPSILAETHHDTTETTHVREPASRPVRASIVSRTESPSIPSEISSCLCRFGAERLVSAMHFTGNQWLELKATVSRWQPVLSHRLLLPPPRPGNTDPQFSLVADDRALLSTYPGQRRQSVTGWTPFPLVFSPVLPSIDFMGSHRGWKLPEIYIQMFYPPRPVEEVEFHWFNAIQGWYAHAPLLRALASIFVRSVTSLYSSSVG